jgi:N12 class adenine-specific DNA methylase
MIMPQFAFDTLEYAKGLEEAGVEPRIAEAQARAQVKILSNLLDYKIATKDDLKELKGELKDLGIKIELLDSKFESKFDYLNTKMDSLEHKLTAKLGKMTVASVAFMATLFTVFHFL